MGGGWGVCLLLGITDEKKIERKPRRRVKMRLARLARLTDNVIVCLKGPGCRGVAVIMDV